jgi:hypothetical protein
MSIRLRHATLKDCNLVIVSKRKLKEPMFCGQCQQMHEFKSYHLRLDSNGEVDVSKTVYDRLSELKDLPLETASKRSKPEPQVLIVSPLGGNGTATFEVPKRLQKAAHYAAQPVPTQLFIPKSMRKKVQGG